MTTLVLIRHGATDWNRRHLVQGSSDIPLSADGRSEVAGWNLPAEFELFDRISSPLSRARETAEILFGGPVRTDDRLREMDWAIWEGRTLADLRAEIGDLMTAWEARGLDFRAPGGESPREVQGRVLPLLAECARTKTPTVAVCHRGVIRAIYALAISWDMTSKAPRRLADGCAQVFTLDAHGMPSVETLDLPLTGVTA
jgi:probable phosphoglycerate mutase